MAITMDKAKPLTIKAIEFNVLVDRSIYGTPAGRGWGVYENIRCPFCGYVRTEIALLGTRGITCTVCSNLDRAVSFFDSGGFGNGDGSCLCPVGWIKASLHTN
jgi:hypothetical protein